MELRSVQIEGLYGIYNHDIELSSKESVAILLGQNGIGKTSVLRLISMFFEHNLCAMAEIPFERMTITLENDRVMFVNSIKNKIGDITDYSILHPNPDYTITLSELRDRMAKKCKDGKDFISPDYRAENDWWIERSTGQLFSTEEMLWRVKSEYSEELWEYLNIYPDWLTEFTDRVEVEFIKTSRLQTPIGNAIGSSNRYVVSYKTTISEIQKEFKDMLGKVYTEYGTRATELDQSYPYRLMDMFDSNDDMAKGLDDKNISDAIDATEDMRLRLIKAGLLDKTNWDGRKLKYKKKSIYGLKALALYIVDSREKFAVFNDIMMRIELFCELINKRFLKKKIEINKYSGMSIYPDGSSKPIPFDKLSSGEQHLIIMYYNLIFKMKKYTLIMIDEPEISLHVSWQKHFILEMKKILELNRCYLLLATHSPTLIGRYWNLTQELDKDIE